MSNDDALENVARFERRRLERRVPGLGDCVFRAPAAAEEIRLAAYYVSEADARAFANKLVAAALESPDVDAERVDGLSERARAIARVAVTDVLGCKGEYKRSAGSGLGGDERLLRVMKDRHQRQLDQLQRVATAVTGNVVRMVERARDAVVKSGTLDNLERYQRRMAWLSESHTRMLRPAYFDQLERLRKQRERSFRPPVIDQLERLSRQTEQVFRAPAVEQLVKQQNALSSFAKGYVRFGDNLARQFAGVIRPSYFGALERMSQQISETLRPRPLGSLMGLTKRMQEIVRPPHLEHLAAFNRRFDAIMRPFAETLREQFETSIEAYAAWVERNWPEVYADPDNPPPVMFILATLPMAIGLPLLRAVRTDDEPLLARLEAAIGDSRLIDELQAAVQGSSELDAVAKRNLVQALAWLREQQYIDTAPPLYHGLERAFKNVARRRGIIDGRNCFLVPARRKKARGVDDLFEHLDLDKRYLRYLRSWVFGDWGNLVRHGDLPDPHHRRWVLRGLVALVGWFEYCAADGDPMDALVERLQLEPGDKGETA
jgi:hypothetical protein